MLGNAAVDSIATASVATVKRYAPPNQRNRSLGRRKSGGDRLERANSYTNDGEKNHYSVSRTTSNVDDNPRPRLIALQGCCNSDALQLLNDRWTASMNAHNNLPEDSSERPVLYTRKGASPWAQTLPPHQKDFLGELRLAMQNVGLDA